MPVVCINRPNRTKERVFTLADVQRISKLVEKGGVSKFKILGGVAFSVGLGVLICKLGKVLDDFSVILRIIRDISVAIGAGLAIQVIIEALKKGPLLRIPILNRVFIALIVLLVLVEKLVQRFVNLASDLDAIDAILSGITSVCAGIVDAARAAADKGQDVGEDIIDFF